MLSSAHREYEDNLFFDSTLIKIKGLIFTWGAGGSYMLSLG